MIYTITLNPAVDRELTVPSIEFDTVLRANSWQVDFGGKGFNVSRMLRSLGTSSTALAFAGGRSGEQLEAGLSSLGINTDFVWVDGDTRTNVSIVDTENNRYVKVNEPGPTISQASQNTLLTKVRMLAKPDDWWVLAGSLPPGVTPELYAELVEIVQNAGGNAILDTSGEALKVGCEKRPFLIKPNDIETHQLTGLPTDTPAKLATAAGALQEMGAQNVVISLGKKGALLVTDEGAVVANTPTITERNPIGAGDSMVGGLVWALSHRYPLPEALCWGIACGAATASQTGTTIGTKEQVETLINQIETSLLEQIIS